jgi:hypothetical protein
MRYLRFFLLSLALLGTKTLLAASLSGSYVDMSPSGTVDLTALSAVDWAHWGYSGSAGFDHRSSGGGQISSVIGTGGASINGVSDPSTPYFSWSDGTPNSFVSLTHDQIYTTTPGGGLQFSVPAGTGIRTLKVYVGMTSSSTGRLQAHLSDSSALDFIDSSVSSAGPYREVIFTLNYSAASAGQSLTVNWTLLSGSVIFLHAAALDPLAPSSLFGSGADISTSSTVDLSAQGGTDWAHWGYSGIPGMDHASSGGSQISDVVAYNGAALNQNTDAGTSPFSWSGGVPDPAVVGTQTQIYTISTGGGFQFSVPAGTTLRTVRLYLGMTGSTNAQLRAHLSDGSSPDLVDASLTGSGPYREIAYTISYRAASPGQILTLTWSLLSGTVIFMHGAVLDPPGGGSGLSGSFVDIPNTSNVDLSTQGGVDWAHWGYLGNPGMDRASGGGSQISNVTAYNGALINQNNDTSTPFFSWSGGTPNGSVSSTQNQLYTTSSGGGFQFSVPADTSTRTLKLYVGMLGTSSCTLQAHLSDGSFPDYMTGVSSTGANRELIFSIPYHANSAGQSLNITWVLASGTVAFMHGAVLSTGGGGGGTLNGSFSDLTPPTASVDLTGFGADDWAHWGYSGNPGLDHKGSGASQIGNVSAAGGGTITQNSDSGTPLFSWSDGTPNPVASGTQNQIYCTNLNGGFQFSAPADTSPKTLKVYVGMTGSTVGKLLAHLSDNSAVDYVDTGVSSGGPYREAIYTLNYQAASAGQNLNVAWTLQSGTVVFMHAALLYNAVVPTATPTVVASPTLTSSPTRTSTPTASPTRTASPSPTLTVTPSSTITLSVTPSNSPSSTQTSTGTSTSSATPSDSATLTNTPSSSVTPSATPSASTTPTQTPTSSATPSASASSSVTPSASATRTPSPSPSGTASSTTSPTRTETPSATPYPSVSDTSTPTRTGTVSQTQTLLPSPASTASPSSSATPAYSPTSTVTADASATPVLSPSVTLTPQPSGTALVPAVLSTNIFRPLTTGGSLQIDFQAPQDGRVTVKIFNLSGEHICKSFDADVKSGLWIQAHWDGRNTDGSLVADGVYFVSVQGAGIKSVRKVIVLK